MDKCEHNRTIITRSPVFILCECANCLEMLAVSAFPVNNEGIFDALEKGRSYGLN